MIMGVGPFFAVVTFAALQAKCTGTPAATLVCNNAPTVPNNEIFVGWWVLIFPLPPAPSFLTLCERFRSVAPVGHNDLISPGTGTPDGFSGGEGACNTETGFAEIHEYCIIGGG